MGGISYIDRGTHSVVQGGKFKLEYSLGDDDIENILQDKVRIISNTELHAFKGNLDQLLEPFGYFILLYESKRGYGHWIAVIKMGEDLVEVFDSYGIFKPDEELDNINVTFKRQSKQDYPYLRRLLYDSGYRVEYNNYPLQSEDPEVATCGRYAVTRILLRDLALKEYVASLRGVKGMSPDDVVTYLTNMIMKKLKMS
jgi:hypothetical protein